MMELPSRPTSPQRGWCRGGDGQTAVFRRTGLCDGLRQAIEPLTSKTTENPWVAHLFCRSGCQLGFAVHCVEVFHHHPAVDYLSIVEPEARKSDHAIPMYR
jgi:hypothetical protein